MKGKLKWWIRYWYKKLSELGAGQTSSREELRGIILSNYLALLGFSICIFLFLMQGMLIAWDSIAFSSGAIAVFFLVPLWANHRGKNLFGRVFITIYLPTSVLFASLAGKVWNTNPNANFETQYYDYRFFLLISGIVAIVLHERHRVLWTYLSLLYISIVLVVFDPLHNLLGVGYFQTSQRDPTYYFTNVVVILAFIAQAVGLFVLRRYINENEDDLLAEIEERKKTELALLLAKLLAEEANNTKSQFMAHMSHELRTPLNGIIGFSDLLLRASVDDGVAKQIAGINMSVYKLLDMVNDILDFSSMRQVKLTLEKSQVDLNEVGSRTLETFRPLCIKKGLDLRFNFEPHVTICAYLDRVRLQQVLMNLLSNAVKFTEKGFIVLSIHFTDQTNRMIMFQVRDTGIGIELKDLQKIFEHLTQGYSSNTKKYGGLGMGLAVSKNLLRLMGSELHVESQIGVGSAFYFLLPV